MSTQTDIPADIQAPPEVIYTKAKKVVCDGGEGSLGHPRVFYDMGTNKMVECKYCDRQFVYNPRKAKA